MKIKIPFLVLMLFSCIIGVHAQNVVYGVITDAKTHESLPAVNVYINNTTLGTGSDANGNYELAVPVGESEMIFSFIGYQPGKIKVTIAQGQRFKLDVKLMPLTQKLTSVDVIGSEDKAWEKNFKQFKRVFLGENISSYETRILNPQYIDFVKSTDGGKNVMSASATQTIEIDNDALGYTLFYDLIDYKSYWDHFKFSGYIFFREMKPKDAAQAKLWSKNRLDAYHGSLRHLFKSILDNRVKEEGFSLYVLRPGFANDTHRSAVFAQDLNTILMPYLPGGFYIKNPVGNYKIPLRDKIEVHTLSRNSPVLTYPDVHNPVGGIDITGGSITVNDDGVVLNPGALATSGYLSEIRVADLLPYDYKPGNAPAFIPEQAEVKKKVNLSTMYEKLYVQTDRSYYYPRDVIWFKVYVKYNAPEMKETLSKVVYVDLIGPDKKIVQSRMLPVENGTANGDFMLPGNLTKGTYYLRSYTQWMRNYLSDDYFIKALPVLNEFENAGAAQRVRDQEPARVQDLEIVSDKIEYRPRDLVSMVLNFRDEYDNAVASDLSVAITHERKSVPLAGEMSIEKKFKDVLDTTTVASSGNKFEIEKGISVAGHFRNQRGKPVKAKIKIIQGTLEDMTELVTDEAGAFHTTGFYFYDSAELALGAMSEKGKKIEGKFFLDAIDGPPLPPKLPVADIMIVREDKKFTPSLAYDMGDRIVLAEVLIEKSKINVKTESRSTYGAADVVVTGQALRDSGIPDIVRALQSKVPGMRITYTSSVDVGERPKIRLGNISTFSSQEGAADVLVTVDDVPVKDQQGAVAILESLDFASIERIEVYKYGGSAGFGSRGANGIIAVYTKKGNKDNKPKAGYDKSLFQLITVKGFSVPLKFKSPEYKDAVSVASKDADGRTTIYWNNDIKTDQATGEAKFSFYAADEPGIYRVVVEGMTSKGKAIHIEKIIVIK